MARAMTTSERRAYQQICGANGLMNVVAADQRGGMRKVLAELRPRLGEKGASRRAAEEVSRFLDEEEAA